MRILIMFLGGFGSWCGATAQQRARELGLHIGVLEPGKWDAITDVPAGIFVGNGFGKLAGSTQVTELGNLEPSMPS